MYLSADVAVLQKATVVKEVRDIHVRPCEEQYCKVLSELCKTQEKATQQILLHKISIWLYWLQWFEGIT